MPKHSISQSELRFHAWPSISSLSSWAYLSPPARTSIPQDITYQPVFFILRPWKHVSLSEPLSYRVVVLFGLILPYFVHREEPGRDFNIGQRQKLFYRRAMGAIVWRIVFFLGKLYFFAQSWGLHILFSSSNNWDRRKKLVEWKKTDNLIFDTCAF